MTTTNQTKKASAKVEAEKVEAEQAEQAGQTEQVDQAVQAGKQTVEQAVAATKEQVEKASSAALKGYDEVASVNKESLDACVKSSNIAAKGVEDLGKAYFALAQSAAETNAAAAKRLMSAKTVNDVFDIQTDVAKTGFDQFLAESTKLSEMTMQMTNEAFAPLQANMAAFVERMTKRSAV